ncbi:MAG TPA: hypothetical protein VF588_00860 [Pyrinomonadaceae bacterium]
MNKLNRKLVTKPWQASVGQAILYDAFIGVVGYEKRASYIASKVVRQVKKLYACAFDERKVYSYNNNYEWFKEQDSYIEEISDQSYKDWCQKVINEIVLGSDNRINVCVDISSMSRYRIAALVAALFENESSKSICVDFLYAPAEYSSPNLEEGPITFAKPVMETFAGWTNEPNDPPVVIIGLGYERDKAVGIVEYIEPGEVWAFMPYGVDERYDAEVKRANKAFFEVLPTDHIVNYSVNRPFECFTDLESLIYGISRVGRPILIPFGPKIFSLCCLLISILHYPSISVWRVSSGQYDKALDKSPNGSIVGITAEFTNSSDTGDSSK